MDEGLIARRYAKAVFRYAQELNAADAVYETVSYTHLTLPTN